MWNSLPLLWKPSENERQYIKLRAFHSLHGGYSMAPQQQRANASLLMPVS